MKRYTIVIALLISILSACSQPKTEAYKVKTDTAHVQRFGSITGLKANKLDYYKKLHAAAWPAVLKKIKECNIHNYSIYLQKIDTSYYLFSYFEYAGKDFAKDMKKMAADPDTQKWWKETDPCQQPLPETAAKGEIWTNMEEVFHTD
ncbi:MAG: L-rhamnose mutarotase [Bacteroidota bacterium]